MSPQDWVTERICRNKYSNEKHSITGFQRNDGQGGNPLYPICVFEDILRANHEYLRETYTGVSVSRYHVKMPYWNRNEIHIPNNYALVETPERLTTTSITVVLVRRKLVKTAEQGFYFTGDTLPTLKERLREIRFHGLVGNLGYYMTKGLITRNHPWSHNLRYPNLPLPITRSYLGFHLFKAKTGEIYSSFQGAHPGAVGIRENGLVDILPKLDIRKYKVKLGEREFFINSINNPDAIDKVMLFTPGLWTPEVSANVENWERYAPLIPIPNRVNIFVTNEGNGKIPIEKAIKIWDGQAPLPSFGAVLSFDKAYFQKMFPKTAILLGQRVKVEPVFPKNSPFSSYRQIMGGLVPAVVDKQHIYRVRTIAQLKEQLRIYGNATSPIARCGRESNNFDPRIREPAGVLIQTHNQIGWVLFDGRHELSIGASVVDVANILKILETKNVFGERIEQAVFVDGGSAMKVYTVESDGSNTRLNILNRVAAGSRNKPGIDPDGLNLYSTLQLDLQKQGE